MSTIVTHPTRPHDDPIPHLKMIHPPLKATLLNTHVSQQRNHHRKGDMGLNFTIKNHENTVKKALESRWIGEIRGFSSAIHSDFFKWITHCRKIHWISHWTTDDPLVKVYITMENHHFAWVNQLLNGPCSIAFCMFTRAYIPLNHHKKSH